MKILSGREALAERDRVGVAADERGVAPERERRRRVEREQLRVRVEPLPSRGRRIIQRTEGYIATLVSGRIVSTREGGIIAQCRPV